MVRPGRWLHRREGLAPQPPRRAQQQEDNMIRSTHTHAVHGADALRQAGIATWGRAGKPLDRRFDLWSGVGEQNNAHLAVQNNLTESRNNLKLKLSLLMP